MRVLIREIKVKSILSKSGIPGFDFCIKPYVDVKINALKRLHDNGIKTYVFIGPLLPFTYYMSLLLHLVALNANMIAYGKQAILD